MKKIFFIAAAIGAVFVSSCSKDETKSVNPGEGITFRAFTDMATRADEIDLTTLGSFRVHAFNGTTPYFADNWTSTDQGNNWKANASYFWPDSDTQLSFYAYNNNGDGPVLGTASINGTTKEITGITPETSSGDQTDLLVAYAEGSETSTSGTVALNFKHVLSQIVVKAKCSNSNMNVVVAGVKLSYLKPTGVLTLPTDTQTSTELKKADIWSVSGTECSYMAGGTDQTAVPLTGDLKDIMFADGPFMVIPQEATGWTTGTVPADGAYISVLCRISQDNGNGGSYQLFPDTDDQYGFSAVSIPVDWEPGKRYTYNLEFFGNGGGGGTVDPDPTDPTDPDDPNIDPDDPGKPVVGGEIKFTVTVDEWSPVDPATEVPMR